MQLTLVGARFRPIEAREALADLGQGDEVLLIRDPSNPYDANAVQVWTSNEVHFIGFVAKAEAAEIAATLDENDGRGDAVITDKPDRLSAILQYDQA